MNRILHDNYNNFDSIKEACGKHRSDLNSSMIKDVVMKNNKI